MNAAQPAVEAWRCAGTGSWRWAATRTRRNGPGLAPGSSTCHGMLAIPGFIEGHGHFTGLGEFRLGLDLREARTWDEIVAQVSRAAKQAKAGEWIMGRGWHQSKWERPPEPNVEGFPLPRLSRQSVAQQSGAADACQRTRGFRQRQSMEAAGITRETPGPERWGDPQGQPG